MLWDGVREGRDLRLLMFGLLLFNNLLGHIFLLAKPVKKHMATEYEFQGGWEVSTLPRGVPLHSCRIIPLVIATGPYLPK